jgi:hypothetical protein
MQHKEEYKNLLIETRKIWDKIPGYSLEKFYRAINNSDKYTQAEKELAKEILLG